MGKFRIIINKIRRILNTDFDSLFDKQDHILNELKYINSKLDNQLGLQTEINNIMHSIYKEFDYSNLDMNKLMYNNYEKKQVLICGFYGAINLGDDLMLETILSYLDSLKNIQITIMLCDKKNIDITNYRNCNFIHYPTKTEDFSIIAKSFDAVIFGGGALLDDKDYSDELPTFNLGYILVNLILTCINHNKKTILYGLSSNKELKNKEYIHKLNFIAENATVFTLRDKNSLETLKKSGINVSKIKVVDDIVLSNNMLQNIKNSKFDKIKLGIVYICSNENYDYLYNYTNKIIEYLEKCKYNYEITFIPFYNHMNNDELIYKRLVNDLNNDKLYIEKMPKKIQELVNIFEEHQYIISMRYHATLIANFMNKNVFSINFVKHRHYFNKLDYLYTHYKFEKNCIKFSEAIKERNLDLLFCNKNNSKKNNNKILLKAQEDIKRYLKEEIKKL